MTKLIRVQDTYTRPRLSRRVLTATGEGNNSVTFPMHYSELIATIPKGKKQSSNL